MRRYFDFGPFSLLGGMYFWGFRGEAKELGGAEASYAVLGGGGPNGVCGSSGVLLDRAARRCGQTDRRRLEDTSAASRASRAPPCLSQSRTARAKLSPFHRNYFKNNKN